MYIDLMMAIADNDLVKVAQTAKATGISVMYPYLDVDLVNLTGRLPAEWKVRKRTKRYLFKKAMQDVLPPEILAKRKQGFGLPVGMWFRANQQFFELLADTVLSRRASERGYFNPGFVEQLVNRHRSGAWDHTQELWLLLVLELWHREYLDART
jgi:asparagine synthase (glutamine-hydrolysing)